MAFMAALFPAVTFASPDTLTRLSIELVDEVAKTEGTLGVNTDGTSVTARNEGNKLILEGKASKATYKEILGTLSYYSDSPLETDTIDKEVAIIASNKNKAVSRYSTITMQQYSSSDSIVALDTNNTPTDSVATQEEQNKKTQTADTKKPDVKKPKLVKFGVTKTVAEFKPAAMEDTAPLEASGEEVMAMNDNYQPEFDYRFGASEDPIREILAKAYINNQNLQAIRASVRVSDELAAEAFAEFMPTMSATATLAQEYNDRGRVEGYDDTSTYSLDVSLPIYNGGQSLARIKREDDTIRANRANLANQEQEVFLEAITSYMDSYRDQKILEFSRQNENILEDHLSATRLRFSHGEVTQTDVSQAEARLSRARADRLTAESDLARSKAVFERVVGEEPANVRLVASPFDSLQSQDDLISIALNSHPLMELARFNKEASVHDIRHKQAALLPNVSIDASKTVSDGDNFFTPAFPRLDEERVALNVEVPFYQSGAEYSAVRRAKQQAEQALYEENEQANLIRQSVITSLHEFKAAKASIASNEAQVQTAERALDGVEQESRLGSRTVLDVLDAQQELFEAKIQLVRSERDEVVGGYNLLAQLGHLNTQVLDVPVETYDPTEHYKKVKRKLIGYNP